MEITTTGLIRIIEKERRRRQLNQGAFAKLLGISEPYYSMVKTGERRPNLKMLTIFKQRLPEISRYVDQYLNYVTGNDHETIQKEE